MQSRELKCFNKLITVCKNRGFVNLADDILKNLAPKYLEKTEIKQLIVEPIKVIKYANKISFMEEINFANRCTKCDNLVEKGGAGFLNGKQIFHVLCGIDTFGDLAKDNIYYKRWSVKIKN